MFVTNLFSRGFKVQYLTLFFLTFVTNPSFLRGFKVQGCIEGNNTDVQHKNC